MKTSSFKIMGDAVKRVSPPRLAVEPGYESLARVLDDALNQAQSGKGKKRHANGRSFDDQRIIRINEELNSNHGALYQICKKTQESAGLDDEAAIHELRGVINYAAAAIRILERRSSARVLDVVPKP